MLGGNYPDEKAPTSPQRPGSIAGVPAQVSGPFGQHPGRPVPWGIVAVAAQGAGLVMLFLGTLIMVVFGSTPADCFTSTCSTSTAAGVQYGILAAGIFWTVGAFGIAVGSAIKLQFTLLDPGSNTAEATARYLDRRRAELVLLILAIVILLVVTLGLATLTAGHP